MPNAPKEYIITLTAKDNPRLKTGRVVLSYAVLAESDAEAMKRAEEVMESAQNVKPEGEHYEYEGERGERKVA